MELSMQETCGIYRISNGDRVVAVILDKEQAERTFKLFQSLKEAASIDPADDGSEIEIINREAMIAAEEFMDKLEHNG